MMYYVQAPQIGGDVTMERTVSGNSPDPGVVQPCCEATALSPFVLPEAHPDRVYEGMLKRVRFLAGLCSAEIGSSPVAKACWRCRVADTAMWGSTYWLEEAVMQSRRSRGG